MVACYRHLVSPEGLDKGAPKDIPSICLQDPGIFGAMRAMHHLQLRKTGRKPVVPPKARVDLDKAWHSAFSVAEWQDKKGRANGFRNCQKRGCYALGCPGKQACPKSTSSLRKAAAAAAATAAQPS